MDEDEAADHKALADFESIESGINVNGVSAEHGKHAHVDVVEETKIDRRVSNQGLQGEGHDHGGESGVCDQQGVGRNCWNN